MLKIKKNRTQKRMSPLKSFGSFLQIAVICFCCLTINGYTETVAFTPPAGWQEAKPHTSAPQLKQMYIGKGSHPYPPSINFCSEKFSGTLKDYLAIIKKINKSHGSEWKNLGFISTPAGQASLSQADVKTEWGSIRLMHAIILNKGEVYILTASALNEEFPEFYKLFSETFQSLKISTEDE